MSDRKVTVERQRVAGRGGDGNVWGVSTLRTEGGRTHRRKPCGSCPFRKDSQLGRFPPEAYRAAANVAEDCATHTFACHESGAERAATCAGFLLASADHNLSVRVGRATGAIGEVGNPDGAPLYASYREMAEANGVDPDDPALARCRGNQ